VGNPIKRVLEAPVSTFSIDVDTGAYANIRRFLNFGAMPPADAVRIEEMINYFDYDYPAPADKRVPFKVSIEAAPTFWNKNTFLLQIGIKGFELKPEKRPAANLVFLIDVSGSMNEPNKLPLLISALRLLTAQLTAKDRVSIVVYAGREAVVLEPTPGNEQATILAALAQLQAGGTTAGEAGIKLAYAMAEKGRIKEGINRVILATDGDFNVGVTSVEALKDLVRRKRASGITLTTLGFGSGNYNDELMEQIADIGNGIYAYIDSLLEAKKVLVKEMSGTLFTIAKDVKVQIEFNPAVVAEYRLIGYVNRALRREDFKNDKVDAGDLGAGHTVTALYEIALVGGKGVQLEPLRYAKPKTASALDTAELGFLKLRYKLPKESRSRLMSVSLPSQLTKPSNRKAASDNIRFTGAVAAFGQLLRGGKYIGGFSYENVIGLAKSARGEDEHGYRAEFVSLVEIAKSIEMPKKK